MSGPRARGGARHAEDGMPADAELMRRLANGESSALAELYDRYHEALRRFLAHATSDAADVDDLVHMSFLAAAQSAARYDGRASCRPWLIGIAVQHLRRRRQSVGRFAKAMSSFCHAASSWFDPRSVLQARGDVACALRGLSEVKRLTLLMAEVEGLTCPEIAAVLGVPVGTVWTRLHAARRELRQALEEDEP